MSYCGSCGQLNSNDSNFCYRCGVRLGSVDMDENASSPAVAISSSEPYVPTLIDKQAVAALVLSILGILLIWALPIQVMALILGIKGIMSERRHRFASIATGLAIFGILCFGVILLIFIMNYDAIISSQLFADIYFTFFY